MSDGQYTKIMILKHLQDAYSPMPTKILMGLLHADGLEITTSGIYKVLQRMYRAKLISAPYQSKNCSGNAFVITSSGLDSLHKFEKMFFKNTLPSFEGTEVNEHKFIIPR
jgi:hypothetical protein